MYNKLRVLRLPVKPLVVVVLLIGMSGCGSEEIQVTRHAIVLSEELRGSVNSEILEGLGSGLVVRPRGIWEPERFYSITDKGTFDPPAPSVVELEVQDGEMKIVRIGPLSFQNDLEAFPLDPEGITVIADDVWIAEETLPSLLKVSLPDATVTKVLRPGLELPEVLSKRAENRGFEGLTTLRNGNLLAALQSPIAPNDESEPEAVFIRLVEYNPSSGTHRMFAYRPDTNYWREPVSVKIGGLQALDGESFLLIERGENKEQEYVNRVMIASLQGATDILRLTASGGIPLEFAFNTATSLFGSAGAIEQAVEGETLFVLNDFDWPFEKAEGVALLGDRRTVAVIAEGNPLTEGTEVWYVKLPHPLFPLPWYYYFIWGVGSVAVIYLTAWLARLRATSGSEIEKRDVSE